MKEKKKYKYKNKYECKWIAEVDEKIERLCLKCDKKFTAYGRYKRLCFNCSPNPDNYTPFMPN